MSDEAQTFKSGLQRYFTCHVRFNDPEGFLSQPKLRLSAC